jgi:hypothetical protein
MKTWKVMTASVLLGGCFGNYEPLHKVEPREQLPRLDVERLSLLRLTSDGVLEPGAVGTWEDDVFTVLGILPQATERDRMYYDFCVGAACTAIVHMELRFKSLPMCWRESGAEIRPGRWLSNIRIEGMSAMDAWDPSRKPEPVDCPDCTVRAGDAVPCAGEVK